MFLLSLFELVCLGFLWSALLGPDSSEITEAHDQGAWSWSHCFPISLDNPAVQHLTWFFHYDIFGQHVMTISNMCRVRLEHSCLLLQVSVLVLRVLIVKPSLAGRHTDPIIQGRPQAISVPKLLLTLFASLVAATAWWCKPSLIRYVRHMHAHGTCWSFWIAEGSLLQSLSSRLFSAIAVCCPRHGWHVSPLHSGILVYQWRLTGGALVASWVLPRCLC